MEKANARIEVLDSVRGLASSQVVIGHCFLALSTLAWLMHEQKAPYPHTLAFFIANSPLHLFWSAGPAVKLFFVLSGFVLSLPYYRNGSSDKKNNYFSFFIKRVIRLYIPCVVIILASFGLKYALYKPGATTAFNDWINDVWAGDLSFKRLLTLLSLNTYFNDIDPALWTLPIEIKLSLILPLFIYFHKRLNVLWSIVVVLAYVVVYHGLVKVGITRILPDFATMYYFSLFIFGSLLCKYRATLIASVNKLNAFAFYGILLVAVFIYTGDYSLWWLPKKVFGAFKMIPEDYRAAIAAIIFVWFALSDRATWLLNTKALLFLGKMSFSLYLTHQVIIVVCVYLFGPFLNPYVVIFGGAVVSVGVAMLFYKLVEAPSLELAKRAAKYITTHQYYLHFAQNKGGA